jgi:hypothetical protein
MAADMGPTGLLLAALLMCANWPVTVVLSLLGAVGAPPVLGSRLSQL